MLPEAELDRMTQRLLQASNAAASGKSDPLATLMPQSVADLAWLGMSASTLQTLTPFVTLLPVRTPVNLNTASATVLFACIPSLDMALAQRLVSARQTAPFRTLAAVTEQLGQLTVPLNEAQQSVNSRFFEVQGRLRLDQNVVEEHSVVQRDGLEVKTLWRDRGTSGP